MAHPFTATPVKRRVVVTADPANIPAQSTLDLTLTVKGVDPRDYVVVVPPSLESGLVVSHAWVSSANTVRLRIGNITANAINPANQPFVVLVF